MDSGINFKLKKLFEKVQQTENSSRIAVPFVPYIGPNYWTARKRVLVVGKATDGWGWKDGLWKKCATLEDVDTTHPQWFEELSNIAPQFIDSPYAGGRV